MKYIDKFPDMECVVDERENVIRGVLKKPCCVCGEATEFVEINYEARFCSEECLAQMDERSDALFKEYLEDFDESKFEENPER